MYGYVQAQEYDMTYSIAPECAAAMVQVYPKGSLVDIMHTLHLYVYYAYNIHIWISELESWQIMASSITAVLQGGQVARQAPAGRHRNQWAAAEDFCVTYYIICMIHT